MVYLVSYFMNAVEKIIEFDKTFADGDRVKFSVLLLHKHNHRQINETTPPPFLSPKSMLKYIKCSFSRLIWGKRREQGLDQFCLNIYVHDSSFTINKELSIHLLSFTLVSMKQEN